MQARPGVQDQNEPSQSSEKDDGVESGFNFKGHRMSQCKPGMTWDNYGSHWVIDHIIPLSAYDLSIPEHVLEANHYTNLQPLTKLANSIKGDSIV